MGIRKLAVAVAVSVFMVSGAVFAQAAEEAFEGEEAGGEDVAVYEAAPPASVAAAPAVEAPAPAPAAEAKPAAKPETKVDFYGAVQYRLRENITMHSYDASGNDVTAMDYFNMFSWRAGMKVKVNDQLALQFQIGNDWGAAEGYSWINNNMPGARLINISGGSGYQNLYVHIASFKWNPGYMFVEGGKISIPSSGTLDLLERSLNIGTYGEAGFQGWSTEANASLLGLKVGVPILKDDIKLGVELFQSILDQRSQDLADTKDDLPAKPTSPLFVVTIPVEAGALKLTPEVTAVLNRNYNSAIEKGDAEIIFGLGGSYTVSKELSFSLLSGYGMVSNENSKIGGYGTNGAANRVGNVAQDAADAVTAYKSNGLLVGAGTNIKAGPGNVQVEVKYNTAVNTEDEDNTKYDYIYGDLRYGLKVNDKFTVTPRYRAYYRTYPENNASKTRLVNRLELILEGSF